MAITSAPVEIILYILQSCDSFTELRALFSTCRRIHNVWLENAPRVVWHVAPKVIPAFDWALLAARATALVHDAHRDGRLPPEIRPDDLTGALRKPSLQELDSVLGLHHFVQCVELRYCHDHLTINKAFNQPANQPQNLWPEDRKPPPPINNNTPEDPGEGMRVWTERFHTAAYTSLLMGAVFARAYNQPFYPDVDDTSSSPSGDGHLEDQSPSSEAEARRKELWDLMRKASSDRSNERHHRLTIKEDMREYLRQFPVYDLNNELGGQENVFGPFIEWYIRFTISQYNKTTPKPASRDPSRPAIQLEIDRLYAAFDRGEDVDRCPDRPSKAFMEWDSTQLSESFPTSFVGSPAEGEAVVWAAMQAVHMFEFILTCITNLDGRCRFGRSCTCCDSNNQEGTAGSTSTSPTPTNLWITPSKAVTAKVVLFGIFQAEEILMQVDVKYSIGQQLVAYSPPTHASASSPYTYPDGEGYVNHNDYLDIPLVF